MSDPIQLHPDSIAALASAIAEKFGAAERAVITAEEVQKLIGKKGRSATYEWLKAKGVKAVSHGRYNRAAIERALADEAGISYRRHQITNTPRRKFEIKPLV